MRRGRVRPGERGSATAWTVPLLGALTLVAVLLAGLSHVLVEVRRVQAAADLAALGAAEALARGQDPCPRAAGLATRNGARLSRCQVAGADVRVVVVAPVRGPWPAPVTVSGRARAGPGA